MATKDFWTDEKGQKVVGAPKPAPSFDDLRQQKTKKVEALKAKIEKLVGEGAIGLMAQRREASKDSEPGAKTVRKQMTTACKEPGCGGRVHYHAKRLTGTDLNDKPQVGKGPVSIFGQCKSCGNTTPVHTHQASPAEQDEAETDAMMERANMLPSVQQAAKVQKAFASLYEHLRKADAVHGATAMAMQAATPPAMDFDHDRRRIKQSVRKLMGDKFKFAPAAKSPMPASPAAAPGAVKPMSAAAPMAKALQSDDPVAEYHRLNGHLKEISKEMASRSEFTPSHDAAALMLVHGSDQLLRAREHHARMQSSGPNRADGMRALLGMTPTHTVHLKQADAFIRAAKFLTVKGDRALAQVGRLQLTPFNEAAIEPDPSNRFNVGAAKAYFSAHRAGHLEGMAQRWKDTWHSRAAAGSSAAAAPAPAPAPAPKKPGPAPASASVPAPAPVPTSAPTKPSLISRVVARGRVPGS